MNPDIQAPPVRAQNHQGVVQHLVVPVAVLACKIKEALLVLQ